MSEKVVEKKKLCGIGRGIFVVILWYGCYNGINSRAREVEQFTDQIRGGEFQMLFDSFEAYDVQETRRISKAEDVLELLTELGAVSEELRRTVMETKDLEKLKTWLKLAAKTESVEQFQRQAGIALPE